MQELEKETTKFSVDKSRKIVMERIWRDRLQKLKELPDNWDNEGAPGPSNKACSSAINIIDQSINKQLKIASIDPDVEGGIDIYIDVDSGDEFWIHCTNNDDCIVVQTDKNGKITSGSWEKLGINKPN